MYRIRAVFIFVKNALERLGAARLVGVVGRSHESSAALQVDGISGKVGVNAFGCSAGCPGPTGIG